MYIQYIYIYTYIYTHSPFQTSGVPGDVRLAKYARGGFMKFQLLHKAVAGLLGSCAGVLLLTTLIVRGNPHVKKRLQLHLLGITCWVCQAQNENDTERILHAANHRLVRFTFMNGGIQASLSMLLVLHCIFASKFFVITMYGGYTIFLLNTRGGWAYFGSKEVTVIFALSWHTLGYIGRRWLSKLEQPVFGNTLTKLYQNCLIAVFLSSLQTPMQRMGYVVLNMVCFSLLGPLLLVHLHLNLKTLAGLLSDKCWSDNTYVQLILSGALGIHILAMWLGSNHVLIICIPQSLLPCILSCAVMYRLGERLQRVFGPGKRDHMPVNLIPQHHSHFSGFTSSQRCVWNTSRLVDGVLRGDRRSELVYQVNQRLDDTHLAQYATFSPTQAVPYPDQIWTSIREAIREPACALYSQQQTKQFERPRDTVAAIQRHQDARASLAALPRSVVQVCDRGHSHQFLSEIFFQWKTSVHFFCYARRQGQVAQTRQASTFGRSYC